MTPTSELQVELQKLRVTVGRIEGWDRSSIRLLQEYPDPVDAYRAALRNESALRSLARAGTTKSEWLERIGVVVFSTSLIGLIFAAFLYANLGNPQPESSPTPSLSCSGLGESSPLRLIRPCAEQGDVYAQTRLGRMYFNGQGVPQDDVLAYMWWNLAAAQGYEDAQSNKDRAEERMTPEQIAEAQRLSREWLEAHPPGGN